MGTNFSSGQTSATIVGSTANFPTPSANQTIVTYSTSKSGQAITAGTGVTVGTVTAGKTFYCTNISVEQNSNNVGTTWNLRDGGVAGTLKASGVIGMANGWERYSGGAITLPTPIAFTGGNAINLDVNNTSTVIYVISGFEV